MINEEIKNETTEEESKSEVVNEEEKKEEKDLPAETKDESKLIDIDSPKLHFELDKSKHVNEQAKDLIGLAATEKAIQDEELVESITDTKKEELKLNAQTNLKQEQVKSSKMETELQHANYGVYEGIADLIGLKKPLPNKMLSVLMFILMPLLIIYYSVFGFMTGIINVTMDCLNAITERFSTFTKSAKRVIVFVAIAFLLFVIFLIIKYFLNKYGIINW